MNKFALFISPILIATTLLVGCASTDANLQRESAFAIGGNLAPNQVTVTSVDRSATAVEWKAVTPSGNYNCNADDMLHKVLCRQQK